MFPSIGAILGGLCIFSKQQLDTVMWCATMTLFGTAPLNIFPHSVSYGTESTVPAFVIIGLQRMILQTVRITPQHPCLLIAAAPYSEQVGINRQVAL